jgi:uncharacterized protein (TIGR02646 family)
VRTITKKAEPVSLRYFRAQAESRYEDFRETDELRDALVIEQRGLCCYCTGAIRADGTAMKIEHWQCRDRYRELQLNYSNLLGACREGEGQSAEFHHCDTRKGNGDLKWNPANPAHAIESRVQYRADGTIVSQDEEFCCQLNSLLGLNLAFLKNSRKAVLDAVLTWWRTTPNARTKVQQQVERRTGAPGRLTPFSPVAVWFLRQKLGGALR